MAGAGGERKEKVMKKVLLIVGVIIVTAIARIAHADYAPQGTPAGSQPKYCWQNCDSLNLQAAPGRLQPSLNVLK